VIVWEERENDILMCFEMRMGVVFIDILGGKILDILNFFFDFFKIFCAIFFTGNWCEKFEDLTFQCLIKFWPEESWSGSEQLRPYN
jgi:hypothetical protein